MRSKYTLLGSLILVSLILVAGLFLAFKSPDYGNKHSRQANECLIMLKEKGQVSKLDELDDAIRSNQHDRYGGHSHLYVGHHYPGVENSTKWNMCILVDGEVATERSEDMIESEIASGVAICMQSVPCIRECGRRWAKYAAPEDAITLSWRKEACTLDRVADIVRSPSLLELYGKRE